MPQLVDPNFSRSVVLLIKHSPNGAFGLVLNRPLVTTGGVVVRLDQTEQVSTNRDLQVWIGGPVEPQRSWILVGEPLDGAEGEPGMPVGESLYLSTAPDLVRRMVDPVPPEHARLLLGYSGWGPGQLDDEIGESAWLLSDVNRDLIFNTPADPHVGGGHSPPGGRSGRAADVARRALTAFHDVTTFHEVLDVSASCFFVLFVAS